MDKLGPGLAGTANRLRRSDEFVWQTNHPLVEPVGVEPTIVHVAALPIAYSPI